MNDAGTVVADVRRARPAGPAPAAGPRRTGVLLAVLFCIQAVTLLSHYRFAVEPFPPEAYDQAAYLARVYELTENYDVHGIGGLLHVPFEGAAQGVLVPFEGAVLEVALRLGRLAPLLLNGLALVLVELALFSTVLRLTAKTGLALAALGLFLSAHSMWFWAGGLFDFRIDWLASCLFGIWACAVLRSGVFQHRGWAAASGGAAAVLILTRFITAVYVFGVEGVLVLVLLAAAPWFPTRRRVVNGLLAMALTGLAVLPFVLDSVKQIYAYYVVGHVLGSEKEIRAVEAGLASRWDHALYYPTSILRDHLGWGFAAVLALGALTVAAAAIGRGQRRGRGEATAILAELLFLAGIVVGPIVVLTGDVSKSPVVGGIVVVPIVLAFAVLPRWLLPRQAPAGPSRWILPLGGAVCLALGLAVSLDADATSRPTESRHGLFAWGRLITDVSRDAIDHDDRRPKIFFNMLSSHFFAQAFTAYAFERTGRLLQFNPVLNDAIFAPEPAWVMASLAKADYVVLTTAEKGDAFPVFAVLRSLDPQIRAWADLHLKLMRSYSFDGGIVDLYGKP